MSIHPSARALVAWLENGRPRRVARHVESCDECMERLDALSGLDSGVIDDLETASAPPPDFVERTRGGVRDRIAAGEAAATVTELLGLAWRALGTILDDTPLRRRVVDAADPMSDDARGADRPESSPTENADTDDGERSNG